MCNSVGYLVRHGEVKYLVHRRRGREKRCGAEGRKANGKDEWH
jgi:hypothetical protein